MRHHHHHHSAVFITSRRRPWLYSIPPWRLRSIHGLSGLILAMLYVVVWMVEAELWLTVWCYFGLFLALRWCWRHNPIGQTIDSAAARRERQQPQAYDPHGAPARHYDLGSLDQRG